MGFLTTLIMNMDFLKRDFLGLAMWRNALTNPTIDWVDWCFFVKKKKRICLGTERCDLYTMLDGLLLVIRNGLGIVPLHVLMIGVEPNPWPG